MSGNLLNSAFFLIIANVVLLLAVPTLGQWDENNNGGELPEARKTRLEYLRDGVYRIIVPDFEGNMIQQVVEQVKPGIFESQTEPKILNLGEQAIQIETFNPSYNSYVTKYSLTPKQQ